MQIPTRLVVLLALALGIGCSPADPATRSQAAEGGVVSASSNSGSPSAGKTVYYRYVEESGTVRFVQRLEEVPVGQRPEARIELQARARPSAPSRPSRLAALGRAISARISTAASAAEPSRASDPEVVLYTTSWCGWCRKTIAHLDRRGVDYHNRNIESDREAMNELLRKTGSTAVPVVEIDGQLVRGFDPDRMDQLLDGA